MASRSKQKGDRDERQIVGEAIQAGLSARKIPLSGAVEGWKGDVIVTDATGADWLGEAKVRATGFRQLYGWLRPYIDFLSVRADRQERLVVMRWSTFLALLKRERGGR